MFKQAEKVSSVSDQQRCLSSMIIVEHTEAIARRWFEKSGIDCIPMSQSEVIEGFFSIQHRLIEPRNRSVRISARLKMKDNAEIQLGINTLKTKFESGLDVNGHLTRRLADPNFVDKLFCDWGIQHMHLSDEISSWDCRLFAGTKDVLFLIVREACAYFIDVDGHTDISNDNYPFEEKRLFEIIASQWPDLLELHKN